MNVWDILAWIAFGIVILYFILKALHILESPEVVDIITILSAGYFVGRYAMNVNTDIRGVKTNISIIEKDVSTLKNDVGILKKDVSILKTDMSLVKTDIKVIRNRFAPAE